MSSFGERLRDERIRLGLSQSALAEACGVQKRSQINYEKGERMPDADYLMKFSENGADMTLLMTGKPSADALTSDEERLLVLYRMAEAGVRKAVLGALATGEVPASVADPADPPKPPTKIKRGGIEMTVHGNIGQRIMGSHPGATFSVDMRKMANVTKPKK